MPTQRPVRQTMTTPLTLSTASLTGSVQALSRIEMASLSLTCVDITNLNAPLKVLKEENISPGDVSTQRARTQQRWAALHSRD